MLVIWGLASCSEHIRISGALHQEAIIFPDYKSVAIPVNIAPLDFSVLNVGHSPVCLLIEGGGQLIDVKGKDGLFEIPTGEWKKLLECQKGHTIKFTIAKQVNHKWLSYHPFTIMVAPDSMDNYVVYRLIPPGYELWNKMGIYQRDIENYDQSAIYENKLSDNNCVNCHSFPMQNPNKMIFHMRSSTPGTVLVNDGKIDKLSTKTPQTISAFAYPSWHPSGRYIAFSTNVTKQVFFMNQKNRIEVYDSSSDIVVYDIKTHQVLGTPLLMSSRAFETFPTFAPDGKTLYFCSAKAMSPMPEKYKDIHYNLCSISFDPVRGVFGKKIHVLYNAARKSKSVSFPRVSPNGKYLVFTRQQFGNFSIWHKDADLYILILRSGKVFPMKIANSKDVESYHSWSHNSRWLVFSSRRLDGLYTRLFFAYIDKIGKVYKPFLLPQKNPGKYYQDLMYSYNIPEFVTGKVKLDAVEAATVMRNSSGINVRFCKR